MAKKFDVTCDRCQHRVRFEIDDVEGLDDHIDAERAEARSDTEEEFSDHGDMTDILSGKRHLAELAIAIRRGDTSGAKLALDVIAQEIGATATEEVERAWFSPQAMQRA